MTIAVFVDAGYLYALASNARFRVRHQRARLSLNVEAVVAELKREVAALDGGGGRLLRIYWYDGIPLGGRTLEQTRTAQLPDVKLRLGTVNAYGEQKGVDALIVHDLSELARNRAMDAAILFSGDEDVLVGVQTAQAFGVRVHLLGIDILRSQSEKLRFEADAAHEWPGGLVAPWIALRVTPSSTTTAPNTAIAPAAPIEDPAPSPLTDEQMATIASDLGRAIGQRISSVIDFWDRQRRIPMDTNSRLMRAAATELRRPVDPTERIQLRSQFVDALRRLGDAAVPEFDEPLELADEPSEAEEETQNWLIDELGEDEMNEAAAAPGNGAAPDAATDSNDEEAAPENAESDMFSGPESNEDSGPQEQRSSTKGLD
ncbi:MAG: NYN domain-containing protein [Candidatus Eremiobacteraeota bacterium]|nr:NYN domain-containing protein [Candidatus Eremiobacteraeota bacterium]